MVFRLFGWLAPPARLALTGVACLFATGCLMPVGYSWPPGYIPSVVAGELNFLSGMVPIEDALEDPSLTDEQREKLAFVIRARDYAEHVVGLNVTNNFQQFVDLGEEPLAWNLTASRKDALEAYTWSLPLVGTMPYLGFFDLDQAMAERDRLVELGYDTFTYEVDTFALWILPDPVGSPLLEGDYGFLADVVMHELLHNTILKMDDMTFSESLAVFVGRTAGLAFLESEFGPDAPIITESRQQYEDEDRFNTFLQGLAAELETLYGSDRTAEEKIAQREDVFQAARDRFAADVLPLMHDSSGYEGYTEFPFNNAFLVVNVRYNSDLDVLEAVYEMTGRNWPRALDLFRQAAAAEDSFQFLKDLLPPD